MTYRELIRELETISEKQLDQTVVVSMFFPHSADAEYLQVTALGVACDDNVLDDNHLVLGVDVRE